MLLEQADFAETGERHGSAGLHVCAIMEGAGQRMRSQQLASDTLFSPPIIAQLGEYNLSRSRLLVRANRLSN